MIQIGLLVIRQFDVGDYIACIPVFHIFKAEVMSVQDICLKMFNG